MSWLGRLINRDQWLVPLGAALAEETEAFLSGHYVSERLQRKGAVPGWAWLNTLAHGQFNEICPINDLTVGPSDEDENWTNMQWKSAQRIIACELLELVDGDSEVLLKLQQRVLVPLELRLIDAEKVKGLSEFELVQSFRAALRSSRP